MYIYATDKSFDYNIARIRTASLQRTDDQLGIVVSLSNPPRTLDADTVRIVPSNPPLFAVGLNGMETRHPLTDVIRVNLYNF